ncbi:MAG: Ig-like domain-containing protein [Ruminococcus sp.]|nr:Ig-like domain-containing protein [Ruminococcus sp.]
MKKSKRIISVFLCVLVACSAFAISAQAKTAKNYVKSISVTKKASLTIPANKKTVAKSFKVTVKVKGKASKKFTAKSSKTSVATVKVNGNKIKVTAKKAGTAKITVTTKAKSIKNKALKATLSLTVKKAETPTQRRLVKGVKVYQINYDTKDWELDHKVNIKYKNAYPTLIDSIYNYGDGDEHSKNIFNYTFENGLPKTCEMQVEGTNETATMEYNSGKLYNVHYTSDSTVVDTYYQYASGNDYFTSIMKEMHIDANEYNTATTMEETDSVAITLKNGVIAKSVNTGFYANWNEVEPKTWLRFNGTYTATYDGDGIAKVMSAVFREGQSSIQQKIKVTKKNGVITKAVIQIPDGNGGFNDFTKVEFEYTDTVISPARFSNMMNYFITGEGTNYYNNIWY